MVEIVPFKPAERPDCVKLLEDALERARAGEMAALAIAWIELNGVAHTSASAADRGVEQIGAVACLLYRLQSEL